MRRSSDRVARSDGHRSPLDKPSATSADDPVMGVRTDTAAGVSAMGRFVRDRGRWRRRVVRRAMLVATGPVAAALVAETVWGTSSLDWALGFFFGAAVGVLAWVWDAPPAYIENWRRGAEGERRTARALRDLERDGWYVRHDVLAERGNRDHIVVGPGGVYLLDTKVLAGVVRVGATLSRSSGWATCAARTASIVSRRLYAPRRRDSRRTSS
jgi:hypothetical protein